MPALSFPVLNTDSADRVLYCGQRYGGGDTMCHFVLHRYLSNGTLDSSFAGGRLEEITNQYSVDVRSVEQCPDGKVLVGEEDTWMGWAAYRYLDNGTKDSSFGGDGHVYIHWNKGFTGARVQPDRKVLFIGYADSITVARVNEDGSWDSSYGRNGVGKYVPGLVSHAVVRPDGRLVLGGYIDSSFALWQIRDDGRIDTTFGQGGVVKLKVDNVGHRTTGLAIQKDGKIILGGKAGGWAVVARFFHDGRLSVAETAVPESHSLVLYHNPANQLLKVNYPVHQKAGQIRLYDAVGRMLQFTTAVAGSSAAELDVHALPSGRYVVEWQVENNMPAVRNSFSKN